MTSTALVRYVFTLEEQLDALQRRMNDRADISAADISATGKLHYRCRRGADLSLIVDVFKDKPA